MGSFLYRKAHKRQKRNRICPEPFLWIRNQMPFPIVNIPEVSEKAKPGNSHIPPSPR